MTFFYKNKPPFDPDPDSQPKTGSGSLLAFFVLKLRHFFPFVYCPFCVILLKVDITIIYYILEPRSEGPIPGMRFWATTLRSSPATIHGIASTKAVEANAARSIRDACWTWAFPPCDASSTRSGSDGPPATPFAETKSSMPSRSSVTPLKCLKRIITRSQSLGNQFLSALYIYVFLTSVFGF